MDVFQQKNALLKILKIAFEICQPKFTPKIMRKYFSRSSFLGTLQHLYEKMSSPQVLFKNFGSKYWTTYFLE